MDWYSCTVPTVKARPAAVAGDSLAGTSVGRTDGTATRLARHLPTGPHSRVPGAEAVVAQVTAAEVWVRSVR